MKDHKVIYINMPPAVKGFVVKMFDDGDDYYTVVLNPCYNAEQQQETYEHELKHIECRDFDFCGDPDTIETLRHA